VIVRPAESRDLRAILGILTDAALPTSGVASLLESFALIEISGSIAGVGGLEKRGSAALLRSLAVVPVHQGHGVAGALCDHLEGDARGMGIEWIYLLTETAERFFSRRGYVIVARDAAPPAIASSQEFSALCPESAAFMRRSL
jgi:amino-acid N-acetyltransferase